MEFEELWSDSGGGDVAGADGSSILYGDLETKQESLVIAQLRADIAKSQKHIKALINKVKKDQAQVEKLRITSATLVRNISVLFNTAKSENERKDSTIVALRAELQRAQSQHSRAQTKSFPAPSSTASTASVLSAPPPLPQHSLSVALSSFLPSPASLPSLPKTQDKRRAEDYRDDQRHNKRRH